MNSTVFVSKQTSSSEDQNELKYQMLQIDHLEQMDPFFMSLISDSEIWAFISSTGALSAGRGHAENSFFPYHTVDKIHDSYGIIGPITLIRLPDHTLWEPFDPNTENNNHCRRKLSRNVCGTLLQFTEERTDLGLIFSYQWQISSVFGLTRKSKILNQSPEPIHLSLMDGLRGITPPGISVTLQSQSSCLTDACKKNELLPDSRIGIYALSAGIIDEPVLLESLKANYVWSEGLNEARVLISDTATQSFRKGMPAEVRNEIRGKRGAYLLQSDLTINSGETVSWKITINGPAGGSAIANLHSELTSNPQRISDQLTKNIHAADQHLQRLLSNCDAFQKTNSNIVDAHHCANVIYNMMRGGTSVENYQIPGEDFIEFIKRCSRTIADRHVPVLKIPAGTVAYDQIDTIIEQTKDPDLKRIWMEYLPFTFSRRHGDPSRPWNKFNIQLETSDGGPRFAYQGNWRDIFQNWEALSLSFPRFIKHIICKFVNASTMDGYNPYRLTSEGFDWEEPDPTDPWSGTGYWGDHQIVYLNRLLELQDRFFPGTMEHMLTAEEYVYADLPYEIVSAEQLLKNPRETILFNEKKNDRQREKVQSEGSDATLRVDSDDTPFRVSFAEKLLVPVLSKLSNFIPGGGIWMNTQRPEWNDANNALVGYGLSMVTTCQLRRHLAFLEKLFRAAPSQPVPVSSPVAQLFLSIHTTLSAHASEIGQIQSIPEKRAATALKLIQAGGHFRQTIYMESAFSKTDIPLTDIADFFNLALQWLDASIRYSHRQDGLYHSYNVLQYDEEYSRFNIHNLYEMLEGQVAVLGTGVLSAEESIDLLLALQNSRMFRDDLQTYTLYPDRPLPTFLEKGIIPAEQVDQSTLLTSLLTHPNNPLISMDQNGTVRFHPELSTEKQVSTALNRLSENKDLSTAVNIERPAVINLYKQIFRHTEFTGRSGTMFGYEGLGCTYWHMVSKLLLSAQETCLHHIDSPAFSQLAELYYHIRQGLGFNKSPKQYGAFPTEPYSHTPADGGAKQPGMTGQVKEEILTRFGELGIRVDHGTITFKPNLLRLSEFLTIPRTLRFFDTRGNLKKLNLCPGELAFTFCQIPVIYQLNNKEKQIVILDSDGNKHTVGSETLPEKWSLSLFYRDSRICEIRVLLPQKELLPSHVG